MENNSELKKRPTFLSVLCIISFVGIGYVIINSLWGFVFASSGVIENIEAMLYNLPEEEPIRLLESLGYFDLLNTMATSGQTLSLIAIIGALICLVGVLYMWKLKKSGYYIYLLGEIGVPVITAVVLGTSSPILLLVTVFGFVFPIAFVIMYGANVKYMS